MAKKYRAGQIHSADRAYVPYVVIPLWQLKIKERYGIDVDKDIIRILVEARYSKSTWKWSRALKAVSEELKKRGISGAHAREIAQKLVTAVATR